MKLRKRLNVFVALLLVAVLAAACTSTAPSTSPSATTEGTVSATSDATDDVVSTNGGGKLVDPINVAGLKGPTGIGMVNLMEKASNGEAEQVYKFSLEGAPDAIIAKLTSGELDIAALPTNSAALLAGKTGGKVQLAALNTLGILYIVEDGDSVKSIDSLKGKTIVTSGQGTTVEYVLNYILRANGLDPEKDVTIEWKSEHSEVATLLASGKANIAVLPEPFVTSVEANKAELKTALNLTDEWDKAVDKAGKAGSVLSMGCIVVRTDFAKENKSAVDAFLAEYKESVDAVQTDLDTTAGLCAKYEILASAAVAKKAIPNCNIVYIDGAQMRASIANFYEVLFEANPQSIGGALPADSFYYAK